MDLNFPNLFKQTNSMLCNTYAQVFPQLNFLSLNGDWVLDSIPLPNLLYLKLASCPIDKLETITHLAPQLRSLDISVNFKQMNFGVVLLPLRLTRFTLKIQGFPVTMNYMEYVLSNLCHLKHLELQLAGYEDLADGQRWQTLTNSLITFNFKFNVSLISIEQTLDSFRTVFWLEEKQWFVAYGDNYLFTVPYFAPKVVRTSYKPPVHSTAPNNAIFYKNVNQLIVRTNQTLSKRLTSINTLEIHYLIVRIKLSNTVNFPYVKHLSILSLENLLLFTRIKRKIPHLCQLTIKNEITVKDIDQFIDRSYKHIRTLEISIDLHRQNDIIEGLVLLFPNIEHFSNKSDIQSINVMTRFIDGFGKLSTASFISLGPLYNENEKFRFDPDLMILKTNRLTYGISLCRIYHLLSSTSLFSIDWWIEE